MLSTIAEELKLRHEEEMGTRLFTNPYRHWAGAWLGMWDVGVLIEALRLRNMRVSHHIVFNRQIPGKFDEDLALLRDDLTLPGSCGFILNEMPLNWLAKVVSGNHWYALRPTAEGKWLNCNSRLRNPEFLSSVQDDRSSGGETSDISTLLSFLRDRAVGAGAQIFHVRHEETEAPEGAHS